MTDARSPNDANAPVMRDPEELGVGLVYEYVEPGTGFPYLLFRATPETYYKVLLRHHFLFVSDGIGVIDRGQGMLDIPFVGADRHPVGDFTYRNSTEAKEAYERFRAAPHDTLSMILTGRKP